ncbi:hypothetical protein [Capillibacterium thermochitinicola]|uniref:Cardiolipin synthase N-terminal domain-containing protein n=1 Tax=Capillibacterium thermochitinicola TaxID=2699427 RepID=A0A8J6HTI3_9FIRM|nr:hypothetical protein [Capillibacterium thermochitinicola]MBA2133956.1 hypothetical protein [Capillibacterium thermochitinicola]
MGYLLVLLKLLLIVLQIVMLTHLATEAKLSAEDKRSWVIGFVLFGGITSLIYYFDIYRPAKKAQNDLWGEAKDI